MYMHEFKFSAPRRLATASAILASALAASAGADQPAAPGAPDASVKGVSGRALSTAGTGGKGFVQKPAWVTDLSLGIKEGYDNNVFLSEVGVMKDRASWVTTVSPKVGFNLAPLLGSGTALQVLSFGYAPEFVTYHDESSESYNAHRAAATVR